MEVCSISMSVRLLLKNRYISRSPGDAMVPPDGDLSSLTMAGDPSTAIATAQRPPASPSWQEVSNLKKAEREARLATRPEWRLKAVVPPQQTDVSKLPTSELSPRELEIVHLDATALAEAHRTRKYTAVETINAFCHVAAIAQDLTNCLTEVLFDEGFGGRRSWIGTWKRRGKSSGRCMGSRSRSKTIS